MIHRAGCTRTALHLSFALAVREYIRRAAPRNRGSRATKRRKRHHRASVAFPNSADKL